MSNPPSVPAPNPYFSGIIYNPSDYISVSGDSALTYSQAIALFIQKTISDSVTGVTNFVNGLTTSSILAKTISATCNLWTNATGEINIGTLGGRSQIIHIGDGNSNLAGAAVHINNGANTASNVQILNGTGSTGTINLGSATSTTNVNSILTLAKPIRLGTSATGETQLGYSVTSTFGAVAFSSGPTTSTIIKSLQVSVTGMYLVTWEIQYAGVAPIMFYSNIANTTSATLKTPTIATGNWGNSSLGLPNGAPFQSTHGSMVVQITANNYLNLLLFFNGTGGLSTDCGYLQYTRIG